MVPSMPTSFAKFRTVISKWNVISSDDGPYICRCIGFVICVHTIQLNYCKASPLSTKYNLQKTRDYLLHDIVSTVIVRPLSHSSPCMISLCHYFSGSDFSDRMLEKIVPIHRLPVSESSMKAMRRGIESEHKYRKQTNLIKLQQEFLQICWRFNVYGATFFDAIVFMNRVWILIFIFLQLF